MEAVFAQRRDAEATAEELLVDDGWKEVESLPRTGYGANGHHEATGPTVELIPANGDEHQYEETEPQQSLLSWAEFLTGEPVKPKKGSQPATASLFEWAMTLEQEREKELVGEAR